MAGSTRWPATTSAPWPAAPGSGMPRAPLPWEVLYSTNFSALELPADADLRDVDLPTGVSIKVDEPTKSYSLGYDDAGRFTADLRFEAEMAPRPLVAAGSTFGKAAHFDQIGRVTGTIELHGESIAIDCWSMRDRTWGRRPENRPRQAAYVTGAGDGGPGFLAVTNTRDGTDRVAYGFVDRGDGAGRRWSTVSARSCATPTTVGSTRSRSMRSTPQADRSWPRGQSVSRIIINRHSFIDINSLIDWQLDGETRDVMVAARIRTCGRSIGGRRPSGPETGACPHDAGTERAAAAASVGLQDRDRARHRRRVHPDPGVHGLGHPRAGESTGRVRTSPCRSGSADMARLHPSSPTFCRTPRRRRSAPR